MSMHEIEDAVEDAIRLLHERDDLDHRSLFWSLLRLQETFGTTPVRFRVLDILLERRFAHQLALEDHPGGPPAAQALALIEGSEDIGLDPTRPLDPLDNPAAGYVRDGALYCEAGSPLWRSLVDDGALLGDDAAPPTPLKTIDLACLIAEEAERRDDLDLIRAWHGLVHAELYAGVEAMVGPQDLDEVQAIPAAPRLREIAIRSGALDDLDFGGAAPPRAFIAASATLSWWYNLT